MQLSQISRRLDHPRRFVSPAPKGHRRKIRTISFNHQPIERELLCYLPKVTSFLESQVAGERHKETKINGSTCHIQAPTKAVHYASPFIAAEFVAKNRNRIVISFARMNNHRQFTITRQPQLLSKNFALDVSRRIIVMIIESDLSPRENPFALFGKSQQALFDAFIK